MSRLFSAGRAVNVRPGVCIRHLGSRAFWMIPFALTLVLSSCSPETQPGQSVDNAPRRAPVLIVSIDTLRSDHLPLYGYQGVETPSIDRLATDGIVFERAFAHAPVTLPSHVSLLSGALPSRHGVRDNPGYRVPGDIEWLPEILRQAGYATGAAVSTPVLEAATGMARGFDFYDHGTSGVRPARETVDEALIWLDSLDTEDWFLFVHFYEPHRPYAPAEPFRRYDPYDGEIATADAALGRLFDGLRTRGLYGSTLVLLTSDHGEGLSEHGERDHGVFVYRESLQVPLIVKLPGQKRRGDRVTAPVQLIDVLPTVTSVVLGNEGSVAGRPRRSGTSLLDLDEDERLIYSESYLPRLYFGSSELRSVIGPRFQYIESPVPELYDLITDPASSRNLIQSERETVTRYRRRIEQVSAALEPPEPVDDATLRELAALGYLGGAVATMATDLPAPSTQVELLNVVSAAYDASAGRRWEEALTGFERAAELNPKAAFVWAQLARVRQELGRESEALDAWLMALRLTDYAAFRLIPAARLALRTKRYDVAADLGRRALEWAPGQARGIMTQVALARGDLEAATRWALEALDADAEWTPPALQVLSVYVNSGRPQDGLRFSAQIEARVTDQPFGLNLMIGEFLVQLGRFDQAVERIESEISRYPERPRAYGYLATLHGKLDQPEQAGSAIDRLLTAVPGPARYVTAARALVQLGFPTDALSLLEQGLAEYPRDSDLGQLMDQVGRSE